MSLTPDGRLLAALTLQGVELWSIPDERPLKRLQPSQGTPLHLTLSPSGRTLAVATSTTIEIWDLTERTRVTTIALDCSLSHILAISGDDYILAAAERNSVHLWRIRDGVLLRTLHLDEYLVAMAYLSDGSRLATATERSVQVWQIESGQAVSLEDLQAGCDTLALNPTGEYLATLNVDLQLCRLTDGGSTLIRTNKTPSRSMAFSSDGQMIAVVADGQLELWQLNPLCLVGKNPLNCHWPCNPILSICEQQVVAATLHGLSRIDRQTGLREDMSLGLATPIDEIALSSDSQLIAIAAGNAVYVQRVPEGEIVSQFDLAESISALALSRDGQYLAAAQVTVIQIWHTNKPTLLYSLEGGAQRIAFHQTGFCFATATKSLITVRRTFDGKFLESFDCAGTEVTSIAMAGNVVAAATSGGGSLGVAVEQPIFSGSLLATG